MVLAALGIPLGAIGSAHADPWQFGGHIKPQFTFTDYRHDDLNRLFGDGAARDETIDIRLKAEKRRGAWDTVIHYELLGAAGDTVETDRKLAEIGLLAFATVSGLPDDRRRLFDLTTEIADRERLTAVQRLDRLSIGYSAPARVLRFGRQAISWGNGLVFHVLDFVNPFSPIAIDKSYKTGDDMFYGQWLLGLQSDVQAIVLPRRDPATDKVESAQSSYAVKWHTRAGEFDLDLLAARHFDEPLFGLGLVRSVGGAVWRMDVAHVDIKGDDNAWSLVTNLDYSWTWGGKNVYGYAEYFRNGVGVADRKDYVSLPPALAARIDRGELFTLARDNAALGMQIELTPLFNMFHNLICNLGDGSAFYQLRTVYDWTQNFQLMAGVNLPVGERGDEYGGIAVPSTDVFAAPGRSAYIRLGYFF